MGTAVLLVYDLRLRNILCISGVVTALRVYNYAVAVVSVVDKQTVIHIVTAVKIHILLVFSYDWLVHERSIDYAQELRVTDRYYLFNNTAFASEFRWLTLQSCVQHQLVRKLDKSVCEKSLDPVYTANIAVENGSYHIISVRSAVKDSAEHIKLRQVIIVA